MVVAIVSWIVLRRYATSRLAGAAAIASAYGSHLFLDWLGKDTSSPPGLTIFWPFSPTSYMSGYDLFGEVSRRYWLIDEFFIGNLKAVGWEVLVLLPAALAAWIFWSGRTLHLHRHRDPVSTSETQ